MRLADLPPLLSELALPRRLVRQSEPAAMDDEGQIAGYSCGATAMASLSAAYCWQAACVSRAVAGRRRVLDLGCASGEQLVRIAALNPGIVFTGLDLAPRMLAAAAAALARDGIGNVELREGDMLRLPFAEASFDAVVSTMAFHHLPDLEALAAALAEVARVLAPGGAVYLADLLRPRREAAVGYLALRGNAGAPAGLVEDYRRSLRAAFSAAEWRAAAAGPLPRARFRAMRPWPVLGALTTPLGPLPAAALPGLRRLVAGLDRAGRGNLADLRLGFLGWGPDPFADPACRVPVPAGR
ncbi:MAG: class I SAM-dependent methyltransferase [Planctomycetes bacterium]|nr:class I SAM-dependent methyltransferase [Planctomycetota bacterium]